MAKPILIVYLLFFCTETHSQFNGFKHPSTLGVNFILNDFKSNVHFGKSYNMDAGLSLNYLKGINSHFDYLIAISGSFPDSVSKHIASTDKSLFLQGDASLRARLLGKQHWINPYLLVGLGTGRYRTNTISYFLIGPGIEFNYKDVYFNTSFHYRPSLTKKLNNHYFYSIGISGFIGKKEKKKKVIKRQAIQARVIAKDSDGDGILDSLDACPTIPGLAKYKGCPLPDRDKDGISDEEDKCPDIAGFSKYYGCPIPDTDGDGINDEQDSCISVPGVRENHGCPLVTKEIKEQVEIAAKNIFFKTSSFELLPKSFSSLDEVANVLKENPRLYLSIEGHTDDVGTKQSNTLLSEKRARTVMQYLISKGIDNSRLTAVGFGQDKPIDSNKTIQGRANNRRVEMKLSYR